MSRRERQRRSPSVGSPTPRREPVDRMWAAFGLACAVLTLMRFLVPAESADDGETLGIVVGWLALAALSTWIAMREGRFSWRPGWSEAAVAALVLPQVIAALVVVGTAGNRRTAVNMLWEWMGIGVAFALVRLWCRHPRERRRLRALLIAGGLLLAALGVWQRFVWYPQIQSAYREWEELSAGKGGHSAAVDRRIDELQHELGPELLALTGSSRAALKQRILDSQEPFGRFGLTNTFGGVLAVVLVLLTGCLPRGQLKSWGIWTPAMILVAVALILTRSRTAWLATLCGLAYLGVAQWSAASSVTRLRTIARRAVLVTITLVPLVGLAFVFGAVDRQDLVEAPKSVLYRIQYWIATRRVIEEHPWFGVGPGNFRQHYLQYKLPEASEEISDPHNLLLDVWSTAGVWGVCGLLLVAGLAIRVWRRALTRRSQLDSQAADRPAPADDQSNWGWLCVVGWLTCGLLFAGSYLFLNRIDRELLWLGIAWIPVAWMVSVILRGSATSHSAEAAAAAAALTLAIHLLTSGGIAMPVITLLLLSLLFVLSAHETTTVSMGRESADDRSLPSPIARTLGRQQVRTAGILAVLSAALLAGCLWSSWGPVTLARLQMSAGEAALRIDGRPESAAELFRQATESDPLDPQAWRGLAFAEASLWQRAGRDAEQHFQAALDATDRMISADPQNPMLYRTAGDLWSQRFRTTQQAEAAVAAVEAYRKAEQRYPNSSQIQADLARALVAAGQVVDARRAAERALQLDGLFVAAGHYDKTFDESERKEMSAVINP